ncbi:MAG: tRNA epoxyqueuosine(34) reductase QueG [Acidobacteria bacterium]|nr:tRNA epoxyqueuosine(34) reductase QueG [Acidobacteriota bacterium]
MGIKTNLNPWLQDAAARLGFDLCGIAPADLDARNRDQYLWWLEQAFHGEMEYMKRFERQDVRALMPGVRSVICVAMNYNTPHPLSTECSDPARGWIARYAWGDDYHKVMRERLERLVEELRGEVGASLEARIYVDTGPLLERAFAWAAALGWIAKNTCLINQGMGSWFFLGEVLTNLELQPGFPAPDRCGSCTACLDACPTGAITEPYVLDARRCISYYTIEVKGAIPEPMRPQMGRHVFGCDICQDVCPWNRAAPVSLLAAFQPRPLKATTPSRPSTTLRAESLPNGDSEGAVAPSGAGAPDKRMACLGHPPLAAARGSDAYTVDDATAFNPPLEALAELSEKQFREVFRGSPVRRPNYRGFLRNVAVAMGNSRDAKFRPILERLAEHADPLVREHARWALSQLELTNHASFT